MKKYRNPNIPNIVFRRLRAGEVIQSTDYFTAKSNPEWAGWIQHPASAGKKYQTDWYIFVYRPIPHLSNLPE